jgi:hypothetical protein
MTPMTPPPPSARVEPTQADVIYLLESGFRNIDMPALDGDDIADIRRTLGELINRHRIAAEKAGAGLRDALKVAAIDLLLTPRHNRNGAADKHIEASRQRIAEVLHPSALTATPEAPKAANHSEFPNSWIPAGMKPWHGGDSAPKDWDGTDAIELRDGSRWANSADDWTHDGGPGDIIAYTPKPATPAPAADRREAIARALAKCDGADWDETCGLEIPDGDDCDSSTCVAAGYEDHDPDWARTRYLRQADAIIALLPAPDVEALREALTKIAKVVPVGTFEIDGIDIGRVARAALTGDAS